MEPGANHTPAARATGAGAELQKRLAVLGGFQGQPDPTIRHAGQASAPASASWPVLPKLAATGAGAGLAAGVLVALLLVLGRIGRLRAAGGDALYDRGVSDRLVDRLEERVNERIAALEAERERLSAREAGLATREREVSAKLDELRAALDAAPEPGPPVTAPDEAAAEALVAREAALQARIAELTQREIGLARRAAEVAEQERGAQEHSEQLALRAAELEGQLAEAEHSARTILEQEPAPEPEPQPAPAPSPVLQPPPAEAAGGGESTGAWNLMVLERLVNDRGDEFPDRRDEWSSYLYFLREYAEPDGTVPSSFDWLIQDTFSELVA